jgi:hypothetical protein
MKRKPCKNQLYLNQWVASLLMVKLIKYRLQQKSRKSRNISQINRFSSGTYVLTDPCCLTLIVRLTIRFPYEANFGVRHDTRGVEGRVWGVVARPSDSREYLNCRVHFRFWPSGESSGSCRVMEKEHPLRAAPPSTSSGGTTPPPFAFNTARAQSPPETSRIFLIVPPLLQ